MKGLIQAFVNLKLRHPPIDSLKKSKVPPLLSVVDSG